jgi:hypothetical protein
MQKQRNHGYIYIYIYIYIYLTGKLVVAVGPQYFRAAKS